MPTYQYACTNAECGNRFERVQAFTDPAVDTCPVCAERVRKVYGSVGVVFKGSGFYRNDSRDTKSSATAPAKSGESSGDAKPAAASGSDSSTSKSDSGSSATSGGGSDKSGSSSSTGSSGGSPASPAKAAS